MKQVLQDVRSGRIEVHDVPAPTPADGVALVAVRHSLISAGTERASASLGAKSLLQKARARPDLVRKVIESARDDGIAAAATKVRTRLDQYSPFGYSAAGTVLDGGGDPRLEPGATVACIGAGYASHAAVDTVPTNLVTPLPAGVSTDEAAFAAPAGIALHAIRLAEVGPGSVVAVVGLGLIGRLAARLLAAAGCTPVGTDPRDDRRAEIEHAAPAESIAALVELVSRGRGADAVLVTAATPSDEPVALAAELCRDRGKVIVVGDVGMSLSRRVFYDKELSLVVARSYGPGRYERAYEEGGLDFPVGYVRWTESRNVEAVLDLIAARRLEVADLVTHRFAVDDGAEAFATLRDDPTALGILLEYGDDAAADSTTIELRPAARTAGRPSVALVGAGQFMRGTLVPALTGAGFELASITARSGASAASLAERSGVARAGTDWRSELARDDVDAVVVATPHSTHAEIAASALEAGKAVFVEKPLAIDHEGLARVAAAARGGGLLLVGHNRRFARLAQRARAELVGPVTVSIRVAAGPLPRGHWLDDPGEGGRVLGEISHFVDLASFFAGAPPHTVAASSARVDERQHSLAVLLGFANGSAATIDYVVTPAPGLRKEHIEVFAPNGAASIDDFVRLELRVGKPTTTKAKRDKGHAAQIAAFGAALRGEAALPVSVADQLAIAAASIAAIDAARTGVTVDVVVPA